MSIATVAIIDEDEKVRREYRYFLKELGIDEAYEFSSITDFEVAYFSLLIPKNKTSPNKESDKLKGIAPDVLKILNSNDFSSEIPFASDQCEIEADAKSGHIIKSDTAKVFGKIVTELVSKSISFDTLVHPENISILKAYLNEISHDRVPPLVKIAFSAPANKLWVVSIDLKQVGTSKILVLKNITKEIGTQLGKINKGEAKDDVKNGLKPLDLVIFRYNLIPGQQSKKWVTKAAFFLKKAGFWPEEKRTKFIAVRYEDDPKEKNEFNHPFIDDLICLPLDRLIFLQKIELILALPKKTSPSFLFVQKVNDSIEISKRITIEQISDLGIAIANPVPLTKNTVGHFYFKLPGQKGQLEVYAKCVSSSFHPDRANEYLVYFSFFGLSKNTNKELKAFLGRDSGYKNLVSGDPTSFRFSPENLFHTDEQKRKKTIAILDYEENSVKSMTGYIQTEIGNVQVISEDTFYGFCKKFLNPRVSAVRSPPLIAGELYAESVSFLVGAHDMGIQMVLNEPKAGDLFLGHEATELFGAPDAWTQLFDGDWSGLLIECISLVRSSKRIQKNFEVKLKTGETRTAAVEFVSEDGGNIVRITFKIPDPKLFMNVGQVQKIESLDCIVIDYELLPEDINAFIKTIQDSAKAAGVYCPPQGPKIICVVSENRPIKFQRLLKSKLFGFMFKPIEVRRLLYLVATAIDSPNTLYCFDNIGWKEELITAKLAREANLVELSEFGATVKSEQPLNPGTMLYLFKSIFANAPDQNLCVRVYHSEKDPNSPGSYLNSMIYFGITDTFLKYTRAYIRETYAANKSKEFKT